LFNRSAFALVLFYVTLFSEDRDTGARMLARLCSQKEALIAERNLK